MMMRAAASTTATAATTPATTATIRVVFESGGLVPAEAVVVTALLAPVSPLPGLQEQSNGQVTTMTDAVKYLTH